MAENFVLWPVAEDVAATISGWQYFYSAEDFGWKFLAEDFNNAATALGILAGDFLTEDFVLRPVAVLSMFLLRSVAEDISDAVSD